MERKSNVYIFKTSNGDFINYCYILINNMSKEMLLIDPAWEYDAIKNAVDNIQGKLRYVLLTHSHIDHTHLAQRFAKEYNVEVCMSAKEVEGYDFSCLNLKKIEDEEILELGDTKVNCLHTPGHTLGSMCFYSEHRLFSGDTVFMEGCGMCSSPGGSPVDMYHSINRLKKIIPINTEVYPAHAYGVSIGRKMEFVIKNNIYFNFKDINHFIDFRMRPNKKGLFDFK